MCSTVTIVARPVRTPVAGWVGRSLLTDGKRNQKKNNLRRFILTGKLPGSFPKTPVAPFIGCCDGWLECFKSKTEGWSFHLRTTFSFSRLYDKVRINYLGDISTNGFNLSGGLMVNYLYDLDKVEQNHEFFISEKKITMSQNVKKELLKFKKMSI